MLVFNNHLQQVPLQQSKLCHRSFAAVSTSASGNNTTDDATHKSDNESKKNQKKDDSNLFLDNLGTIFLGVIGLIVAALVRSSHGSSNRNKVRDFIEETSPLDPVEIDDLRVGNSEFTVEVFEEIMRDLEQDFPTHELSYNEFVPQVRKTMARLKGDAFTIELGHLIDRVVEESLQSMDMSVDDKVSLPFLLTALSLALHSDANDRVRVLYKAIVSAPDRVSYEDVVDMVKYLQMTCQLVPDTQVLETDERIPTQKYKRASPEQLMSALEIEGPITLQTFADILRSKPVCAWGECYLKKKPSME